MDEIEKSRRLKKGIVYLKNEFEGCVVRSTSGSSGNWFAKFPGEKEYSLAHSTNIVTDAFLEWIEISSSEYNEF